MSKEICIVYVLYLNSIEQLYAFESKDAAEAKCFKLCREWVHENSFNEYLKDNKVSQITLETYSDYFIEIGDDSYVGINTVILEP